jgi:hypothetical protein
MRAELVVRGLIHTFDPDSPRAEALAAWRGGFWR